MESCRWHYLEARDPKSARILDWHTTGGDSINPQPNLIPDCWRSPFVNLFKGSPLLHTFPEKFASAELPNCLRILFFFNKWIATFQRRRWSNFEGQLSVVHFFGEDLAMASSSEVRHKNPGDDGLWFEPNLGTSKLMKCRSLSISGWGWKWRLQCKLCLYTVSLYVESGVTNLLSTYQ